MILRRVMDHVRRQDGTAIAIDFLIVVPGVFVGLQAENWSEARVESERESFYLSALHGDFGGIIAELEGDIATYEGIANAMTLLIDQSRKATPDVPLDALNEAARQLITMEGTPIVSDTYLNLTGSGDLAVIRSQEVKNAVSAFFRQAEVVKLVANTHELQLVNTLQPYIIAHLDYTSMFRPAVGLRTSAAKGSDRVLSVLASDGFRNVVAVKWDITTDIRGLLLIALDKARAVHALLAREVGRRESWDP